MTIAIFFFGHWFLSLFAQTFYLHRYAAHGMFSMSKFWERFFFVFTYIVQGSSFLNPRAYAVMHRMHHAYSDTEKDPHSPGFFRDVFQLMLHTKEVYMGLLTGTIKPDGKFTGNYPVWEKFEQFADLWTPRVGWVVLYALFYWWFATAWWMFLLIPIHALMGPIHGAFVNWCGHKYGYVNYETRDQSRNSVNIDVLLMGELFQNNHHKFPSRANFAVKWFEFDPTYPLLLLLDAIGIITLKDRPGSVRSQ
ncbi:MAG: acyl-CoA desaturase [Bacteroidota bacterium]